MRDPLERGLFRPVKDFECSYERALFRSWRNNPFLVFRGQFLPILTGRRRLGDWTRDTDAQFKSLERWGNRGTLANNQGLEGGGVDSVDSVLEVTAEAVLE